MTPWYWVALGSLVGLIVYEIVSALREPELTISELVWKASAKSRAIPFGFGLLMGHFFL